MLPAMSRPAAAAIALALAIVAASPAAPQAPQASVALLMDLSYSLRLREGGSRRIDLLRDAVSRLIDARGIEWALLSFRDLGDFRVHVPFTEDAARVRAALPALPDGRLSPIREAVGWAGEYLADHARSPRRALVLVSDGIGTGGTSFAAAVGKGFADEGVALFVLGVDHKDNPPIREALEAVARETGGGYFVHRRADDLARALIRLPARRPTVGAAYRATRLAQIDVGRPAVRAGAPLPSLEPWLLGGGAAGLALFVLLRASWRRADARREVPRRLRLLVGLWVTRSDGSTERLQFERPPVRVGCRSRRADRGAGGGPHRSLRSPGTGSTRGSRPRLR